MKNKYTRIEILAFLKGLDTRAKSLTDAQMDNVINRGYAELLTTSKRIFSNEEVVSLDPFYESGESKITLEVEDDATEIYDIYTTIEGDRSSYAPAQEVVQGVGIYRNTDFAFRDNRAIGRFHLDLDAYDEKFDNVIVKYYYTPKATDEDVYMDAQTYLSWTDAMWAAMNYFLKDVEGEAQKRASMHRTSKSMTQDPEDVPQSQRAIFGGWTTV